MLGVEIDKWVTEIQDKWTQIPLFEIDPQKLRHLAIICDGNRRAARERGLPDFLGHQAGVETILGIAQAGRYWGINTLTFWVWSTENWERDKRQINFVMRLARERLSADKFKEELAENEVRFKYFGRSDRLPAMLRAKISVLENFTESFNRYHLNLAMDYGGLDEIGRAMIKMGGKNQRGEFDFARLRNDPRLLLDFLDTAGQPNPDLVIRTGVREDEVAHTSGFMPLQTAYAGWMFLPDLFPNLTPERLLSSIQQFVGYERRLGR
ncbi:di-trans,poly-cis-decaprenylcistransferase [Patescibacteria group bacterium]|nr:di-trans,poly-cis-decaprenylcistransferase [Patescibacteria group bacterium]